ncbi:MAG TPA: sigma-70 family RNA polymerase sigma factor [Kofleriaceae bacterium]|nr:sigma-70 family RNA polymerase sigma factor [Kofleriaceae bacterium]
MGAGDPQLELERALDAAVAAAQREWPGLALDPARFRSHLAERVPEGTAPAELAVAVCIPDLFLACACALGVDGAALAFEKLYMPVAEVAGARLGGGRELTDEVKQLVREILFVGAGSSGPAIADFSGRGNLKAWVRVIATREGLRILRRDKGRVGVQDEGLYAVLAPTDDADPQLAYLKERYRAEFRRVFLSAVAELPRRERLALRLHVLDGLSIDEIAPIYRVHRSTAARWLTRARELLLSGTRAGLMRELGLGASDVDSVIRLIQSNLDVSLSGALLSQSDGGGSAGT